MLPPQEAVTNEQTIISFSGEGERLTGQAGPHTFDIMPNGDNIRFEIDWANSGREYSFAPDVQTAKERIARYLNERDPEGNYHLLAE